MNLTPEILRELDRHNRGIREAAAAADYDRGYCTEPTCHNRAYAPPQMRQTPAAAGSAQQPPHPPGHDGAPVSSTHDTTGVRRRILAATVARLEAERFSGPWRSSVKPQERAPAITDDLYLPVTPRQARENAELLMAAVDAGVISLRRSA